MEKKKLEIDSIPEVRAFVNAKEKYDELKEACKEVIDVFVPVIEEYNASLVAADKAVRATGCSCGPFVLMSVAENYDAQTLHDALGIEAFLRFGGSVEQKIELKVDKNKVKAAVANGHILPDVAERACKRVSRYQKPHQVEI